MSPDIEEIKEKKKSRRNTPKKEDGIPVIALSPERMPRKHFRRTSSAQSSVAKKRVKAAVAPVVKTQEDSLESQTLQALTLIIDPSISGPPAGLGTDSVTSEETTSQT